MKLIKMYVENTLKYALIGAILTSIIYYIRNKGRHEKKRIVISKILFGSYICALLSQTIFPRIDFGILSSTRMPYIDVVYGFDTNSTINIIPLKSLCEFFSSLMEGGGNVENNEIAELNIIGNIILFVPMGLLLPVVDEKYKSMKQITFLSVIASLLIEIIQLFIGRSFDVDDIIVNTIGAIFGYFIYLILKKIIHMNYSWVQKKRNYHF